MYYLCSYQWLEILEEKKKDNKTCLAMMKVPYFFTYQCLMFFCNVLYLFAGILGFVVNIISSKLADLPTSKQQNGLIRSHQRVKGR